MTSPEHQLEEQLIAKLQDLKYERRRPRRLRAEEAEIVMKDQSSGNADVRVGSGRKKRRSS